MSSTKAKEPSIAEKLPAAPEHKGLNTRTLIISIVIALILIGGVGSSIYFYHKYQTAKELSGKASAATSQEVQDLIKKVGALIELPTNESPTVATVSDITKLKNQKFFENAKNGDKVLIYTKARKAILYDPTANKIVEVETINVGPTAADNSTASTSASPTPAQVKVVIVNGTKTVGLATTTEKILTSAASNVVVVSKGNTSRSYDKTTVVDLSGKNQLAASQIAQILKGEVGKLPSGEVKPTNADILIILGGK